MKSITPMTTRVGAAVVTISLAFTGIAVASTAAHSVEPASTLTAELDLTGEPQPDFTITGGPIAQVFYGDVNLPEYVAEGQLSSGDVTWDTSDDSVATIDQNGVLTIVGAGTVEITAIAPADTTYDTAAASIMLEVSALPVTVTADDHSMVFGETIPALGWTVDPALVGDDTLDGTLMVPSTLVVGGNAITENPENPITNDNYDITFEAGVLTVTANAAQQVVIDAVNNIPATVTSYEDADLVAVAWAGLFALMDEDQAAAAALPLSVYDRLDSAAAEAGEVNHVDPVTGITATGDQLDWFARLMVSDVTDDEAADFAEGLEADRDLLSLQGIHFENQIDGTAWQPSAGTAVTIALPDVPVDGYSDIQVQHQLAGGELETIDAIVDGTTVTFDGTSFSLYGVSGVANSDDDDDDDNNGGTDNGGTLPNTGSEGHGPLLLTGLGVLLAGAGALVVSSRRKRA